MSLKHWFVVAFAPFVLLLISGCSAANVFAKPTITPTAVATNDDAALQAAATNVAQAMALVNYKDPTPWETALLNLSNNYGKSFWQANFAQMLRDVVAHKRIAEKVTVQQVVVAGRQTMTDAQGKVTAAAIVLVTGTMNYSDDQGEHADVPLSQPMLFANLDGQWQFVEFVPPSALATPTPSK